MGWRAWLKCAVCVALALSVVIEVKAKQPIFVSWLVADDPGDQTILHFWERYEQGELSPTEMVDLGTMLFYRGYPKDSVDVLEAALDLDKGLHEAWFRIGLVEHQQGNLRDARIAYKRSLDLVRGQGWCNFYLGLLEEQEGHGKKAMGYYKDAFQFAPELANPEVNPEMASSDLWLGAWLLMVHDTAFKNSLPMPFMHPNRVERVRSSFDDGEPVETKAEKKARRQAQRQAEKDGVADPVIESSAESTTDGGDAAKLVPVTKATRTTKSKSPQSSVDQPPKNSTPEKSVKPPPPATPDGNQNETPYGLPGNRSTSADAYPGF